MLKDFKADLQKGKRAEKIVINQLTSLLEGYIIEDVSEVPECYYLGDIRLTDRVGRVIYVEVKNDTRIAETGNVLCEEEVFYKESGELRPGNMFNSTDVYAVVSQQDRCIYFFDFYVLLANYKKGEFRQIEHYDQTTYCYLVNRWDIERWGGLIGIIYY